LSATKQARARALSSALGVSPATVHKWLKRFAHEGIAGLKDRSSRPHRLQTIVKNEQYTQIEMLRRARQSFWKIAAKVELNPATVARIGKSMGLSRLSSLDPKPQIIRYERSSPSEMIHIDIKKLRRIEGIGHRITGDRVGQSNPRTRKQGGKGWEYVHLTVDDHSRLAYSQIRSDEKRASCLKFLFNTLRFLKRYGANVERMMTNNGADFRSCLYSKSLIRLKIKNKCTKPYTPRTNGKAEITVLSSLSLP